MAPAWRTPRAGQLLTAAALARRAGAFLGMPGGPMAFPPQGMPGRPGHQHQQQAQAQPQPEDSDDDGPRAVKRPRLVWTEKLHRKFIEVVQQLGVDKAQPKTIMQVRALCGGWGCCTVLDAGCSGALPAAASLSTCSWARGGLGAGARWSRR